jgi:hypothetical protein
LGAQADAAASLLADALAPVEWAVFRHVAGLMRAALQPENAAANGLTAAALSALLADLWFGQTPHSYKGKGDLRSFCCVYSLTVSWRWHLPD